MNLAHIDIRTILPTALKKKSRNEYAGACPFCGGTDRFCVWLNHDAGKNDTYWCRGCEEKGDAIDYLKKRESLSYKDACKRLGVQAATNGKPQERKIYLPERAVAPSPLWQESAKAFVDNARAILWEEDSKGAIDYLRQRGFTVDTITDAGIGYNPGDQWDTWDGERVWLPRGIVLPTWYKGELWKVQLRRPVTGQHWQATKHGGIAPDNATNAVLGLLRKAQSYLAVSAIAKHTELPTETVLAALATLRSLKLVTQPAKYITVKGSTGNVLYGADNVDYGEPVVLCEGVFDALAITQATDYAYTATAIGTTKTSDMHWLSLLSGAKPLLLALDNDPAGIEAVSYWQGIFPDPVVLSPQGGKDASDMLAHGDDITNWIQTAIDSIPEPEPTVPTAPITGNDFLGYREHFDTNVLNRILTGGVDVAEGNDGFWYFVANGERIGNKGFATEEAAILWLNRGMEQAA